MQANGWRLCQVGAVLALEYGAGLPEQIRSGQGFPVYGSSGSVGYHNKPLVDGPGVIVGRKGSVGAVFWSGGSYWPIDTTYYVRALADIDLRWSYRLLSWLPLRKLESSTGVPGLSRNDVYKLPLMLPSRQEQRHIANILDTADAAIQQTEALIAKLKLMRMGLLHDLLTRGLDERGEMRDPVAHPEQFHETTLGLVPREWNVTEIGKVARVRRGASPRPIDSPEWFADIGPGWVRISDVTRSKGLLRETEQRLSPAGTERSVRVFPGQVIMSIAATIGEPIILDIDACIHDGFVVFDRYEDLLEPQYLVLSLRLLQAYFRGQGQTGTQANLNTGIVNSSPISLPPLDEQRRITQILDAHDARITIEETYHEKLTLLKQGLMDDLLTGRVRVPVAEEAAV